MPVFYMCTAQKGTLFEAPAQVRGLFLIKKRYFSLKPHKRMERATTVQPLC